MVRPAPPRDAGFSLVELLIVAALIAVIASVAVPGLIHARVRGNETSAIASLKAVASAQLVYAKACGEGGFAVDFTVLAVPTPGSTEPFLSPDLTGSLTPRKSGYLYTLAPGAGADAGPDDCNGAPTASGYYATAAPDSLRWSGNRAFALNAGGIIWQLPGDAPPAEPFGPPAAPLQ